MRAPTQPRCRLACVRDKRTIQNLAPSHSLGCVSQSPAPAFGQAAPAAAPAFGATTGATGFGATGFGVSRVQSVRIGEVRPDCTHNSKARSHVRVLVCVTQAAAKPAGFGGFGTTTAPNPFGAPSPVGIHANLFGSAWLPLSSTTGCGVPSPVTRSSARQIFALTAVLAVPLCLPAGPGLWSASAAVSSGLRWPGHRSLLWEHPGLWRQLYSRVWRSCLDPRVRRFRHRFKHAGLRPGGGGTRQPLRRRAHHGVRRHRPGLWRKHGDDHDWFWGPGGCARLR